MAVVTMPQTAGALEDLGGTYRAWFTAHSCSLAVVRPDWYVYGTARMVVSWPHYWNSWPDRCSANPFKPQHDADPGAIGTAARFPSVGMSDRPG